VTCRARKVACPTCRAEPGAPCQPKAVNSRTGDRMWHRARVMAGVKAFPVKPRRFRLSEPHEVRSPSTHEEVMASDNRVIRDYYDQRPCPGCLGNGEHRDDPTCVRFYQEQS